MSTSPNNPCECGSGKKYKKCYWKPVQTKPMERPSRRAKSGQDTLPLAIFSLFGHTGPE